MVITGALGLVAQRTVPMLASQFALSGLDLRTDASAECPVEAVDLADYAAVREAVEGADAVVHLAIASQRAMSHLSENDYAAAEVQANVLGTRNVMEASADAGVKRLVYFSSLTIHLGSPERAFIGNTAPIRPLNHYAVTKLYGEQLAWLYANQQKLSTVCWRLGQPYPVEHFKLEHLDKPDWRSIAVSSADMARGIAAGLTADLSGFPRPNAAQRSETAGEVSATGGPLDPIAGHVIANLVSASNGGPEHGYDLTTARALGYTPADCFTARGPVPAVTPTA